MDERRAVEVLSREGRTPWPRRAVAVGLAALLVLVLLALMADHRLRGYEDRAVDACAARAREAFAAAAGPLDAMTSYVRPVLENDPTPRLRRGMYELVSETVSGADARVVRVARKCREIEVSWAHPSVRARRDACVQALDERAAFLRAVARQGHEAFRGERPRSPDC